MLRIDKLSIPGLPVLSFEVAAGECLCIEGPSGSGKTRILRAIADLDPSKGQVFLEGAERAELAAIVWRRRVRYVAAEPGWWADTARGHVPIGAECNRFERMAASLGLEHRQLDQPLAQLSTGERLRLALARSLCDEPQVILLDEPTSALDAQSAALAEEFIRFQILAGRCVVLISHDAAQIGRLADHRLLLGAMDTAEQAHDAPRPLAVIQSSVTTSVSHDDSIADALSALRADRDGSRI